MPKDRHMSKDCTPWLAKHDRKITFTQIQALIAQLDQEERAELRESAETEGLDFWFRELSQH